MTEKKPTVAERLKALGTKPGNVAAPVIEKIEKRQDQRKSNGGARAGSGRKPAEDDGTPTGAEQRRTNLAFMRAHGHETVDVRIEDKKTGKTKIVKMTRLQVVMEKIFAQAQQGNESSQHEYLDRVLGKAVQPVEGGDDDSPPIRLLLDF